MARDSKKAKKTTQAKLAGKGNANANAKKSSNRAVASDKNDHKKGWKWAPFTKKAVTFHQAAKTLAAEIESLYGKNVSITQFEKFCVAPDSMSTEERDLVHVSTTAVESLLNYIKARDERDSERAPFGAMSPSKTSREHWVTIKT